MRVLLALAALILLSVRAEPGEARPAAQEAGRPTTGSDRTDQGANPVPTDARIAAAIKATGFEGVYAVSRQGARIAAGSIGAAVPGGEPFRYSDIFPWASVTKQVVATMVMQEVDKGRLSLDARASRYVALGTEARFPTIRQLLQHRAGLRNPDDSAKGADGWPAWYTSDAPGQGGIGWCLSGRGAPGGGWRYNNCDYLVLGAIVAQVERKPLPAAFVGNIASQTGIATLFEGASDPRADANWPGGPTGQERTILARFGAAGGLVGTAGDMLAFDEALLRGDLLSPGARRVMWDGDPRLGGMALGQWSFTARLQGCTAPVRIVERRGGIGRFQARNVILPDAGIAIVLLTNRPDFDFGEIWQGKGASYAILSAAACGG